LRVANFARKNQVNVEKVNVLKLAKDSIAGVVIPKNINTNVIPRNFESAGRPRLRSMMQVLTNLNKNAIEAMPNGGELSLIIEGSDHEVTIRVTDTGEGIPAENMDKLFTPFFTTKGIGKGTGLGLATTYGIVKMHRGRIEVDSNSDPLKGPTGTTFSITLPRNINADSGTNNTR
jgi:signal transduction histidine kinase